MSQQGINSQYGREQGQVLRGAPIYGSPEGAQPINNTRHVPDGATDVTITAEQNTVSIVTDAGARTATLPSIGAVEDGHKVTVVRLGGNDLTVSAAGSDQINEGSTAAPLSAGNNAVLGSANAAIELTAQKLSGFTGWVVSGSVN